MLALASASYYLVEQRFLGRGALARGLREKRALILWPAALLLVVAGTSGAADYSHHQQDEERAASTAWWSTHPEADLGISPTSPPAASVRAVSRELSQALAVAHQGAPLPPDIKPNRLRNDVWQRNGRYLCSPDAQQAAACVLGDPNASRTVAVVGDSHAAMWLPALDEIGRREHLKIVRFILVSCAPYRVVQPSPHLDQQTCDSFRDWTLSELTALQPDTIILGARGYLFLKQQGADDVASQWQRGVTETATAMRPLTQHLILLSDTPARTDPLDCVTDPESSESSCAGSPTGSEIDSNKVTREAGEAAGGHFVDVSPLVCTADECPLFVGGDVLYRDGSHLTITWVKHVNRALEQLLRPLVLR